MRVWMGEVIRELVKERVEVGRCVVVVVGGAWVWAALGVLCGGHDPRAP